MTQRIDPDIVKGFHKYVDISEPSGVVGNIAFRLTELCSMKSLSDVIEGSNKSLKKLKKEYPSRTVELGQAYQRAIKNWGEATPLQAWAFALHDFTDLEARQSLIEYLDDLKLPQPTAEPQPAADPQPVELPHISDELKSLSDSELLKKRSRAASWEKLNRASQAIKDWNKGKKKDEQIAITAAALETIAQSGKALCVDYVSNNPEVKAYNESKKFTLQQNRKKQALIESLKKPIAA